MRVELGGDDGKGDRYINSSLGNEINANYRFMGEEDDTSVSRAAQGHPGHPEYAVGKREDSK